MLRFFHVLGVVLLGGGLLGVWVADLRSRFARSVFVLAEACHYEMLFYYGLVFPGALLVGLSGLLLILELGLGFFAAPWLTGMWVLFLAEFVEGNSITHWHLRRMRERATRARLLGQPTEELREQMGRRLGSFTHFLDLPLFLVIVFLGTTRPGSWSVVVAALAVAVAAAALLTALVPRHAPMVAERQIGASQT